MKGKAYNMIKYRTMLSTANDDEKKSYSKAMRQVRGSTYIRDGRDYIIVSRGISGMKKTNSRRRIMSLMTTEDCQDVIEKRENED